MFYPSINSLILKAGNANEDNKENNDKNEGDERSKYEINIDYANNTDNYTIRLVKIWIFQIILKEAFAIQIYQFQ